MRNAGRVVSKTMIMEHVWDYHFDPQTNVVEARICRLRDKIDREFEPKLIHTVRGVGYVLRAKKPLPWVAVFYLGELLYGFRIDQRFAQPNRDWSV